MTDLTEQLYAGTLPTGHYYFNNGVETYIVLYSNANTKDRKMQEPSGLTVLSEVPSYEEYLSLTYAKEEDEKIIAEYEEENTKLKELLKECREPLEVLAEKRDACDWYPEDVLAKLYQALGEDK